MSNSMTAARRLLEVATRLGVKYIFTNLGSDHPAFIEAFAAIHEEGGDMPKVIVCPHEMTALSAAHGYAMITRRPQIVLVHVDVGTQNLGSSIHNASRARVPAIIIAGLSPVSTDRERVGSRTEFIHYTQDVPRQHEIVSQYMKWSYELRASEMVDAVLLRGVQLATTMPEGPVYITGAREVWDEPASLLSEPAAHWPAACTAGLLPEALAELYQALNQAKRPLVITTYMGRQPAAVERMVALSDRLGLGVCEVNPQYLNFPGDHPHHVGYRRNTLVDEADLILMIDVDVPWLMSKVQPAQDARLFHIDQDAVKQGLGYWHFPAHRAYQADSLQVLDQLLAIAQASAVEGRDARCEWIAAAKKRVALPATLAPAADDAITVQEVGEAVRELVNERTVVLIEAPTCSERLLSTLRMARPRRYFANGGCGLGWSINAAIGIKLADPEAEVISLVGDGSYIFGVPSSAYWVAGTYRVPQLTVIFNNRGWHSPKVSTLLMHKDGTAERNDTYWITVGVGARLADIAGAAGDAAAFRVSERNSLKETLQQAMETVRAGRSAVVEVMIAPISAQVLD
jgi:acetolactate synthase-1/2/3 large subunit